GGGPGGGGRGGGRGTLRPPAPRRGRPDDQPAWAERAGASEGDRDGDGLLVEPRDGVHGPRPLRPVVRRRSDRHVPRVPEAGLPRRRPTDRGVRGGEGALRD